MHETDKRSHPFYQCFNSALSCYSRIEVFAVFPLSIEHVLSHECYHPHIFFLSFQKCFNFCQIINPSAHCLPHSLSMTTYLHAPDLSFLIKCVLVLFDHHFIFETSNCMKEINFPHICLLLYPCT